MTAQTTQLSIVTATYNSIRFIDETRKSVLTDEVDELEWIIVDDGSTDGTAELLEAEPDPRIKLFRHQANQGIGPAYAEGVSRATGEYLLILDHDDTIPAGSLAIRLEALKKNPDCQMAFGITSYMDEHGSVYHQSKFPFAKETQLLKPWRVMLGVFLSPTYPLKQGAVLLRTSFIKANPDSYDIELFLRAASAGKAIFVATPCLNYRTFRNQFSSSRKTRLAKFFHFYWAKYALRFLPWYLAPLAAIYRTGMEFLKVVWCMFSPRRT